MNKRIFINRIKNIHNIHVPLSSSTSSSSSKISRNYGYEGDDFDLHVPPVKPIDFGSRFIAPKPLHNLSLAVKNRHALDDAISFDEETHKYIVDGKTMKISVTTLISSYFDKFDSDVIIERMMKGNNWPREGYIDTLGQPMTAKAIKDMWTMKGMWAANYGTWVHHNIERLINDLPPADDMAEIKSFRMFKKEVLDAQGIKPYRTEWRIASAMDNLAGSVDFVGQVPDGSHVIIDWKTSKKLSEQWSNAYGKKASYPINDVDDCEKSKYTMQLNLYKHILERYYGLTISKMMIASFQSMYDPYFCVEVDDMQDEVAKILHDYRQQNQNQDGLNFSFEDLDMSKKQ